MAPKGGTEGERDGLQQGLLDEMRGLPAGVSRENGMGQPLGLHVCVHQA